jgi:hypothetical protein
MTEISTALRTNIPTTETVDRILTPTLRKMPRSIRMVTAIGGMLAFATGCTSPDGANSSSAPKSTTVAVETFQADRPHHCLEQGDEIGSQKTEVCLYDDGSQEGGIFETKSPYKLVQKLTYTDVNGQLCIKSLPGDTPLVDVCPQPFVGPFETAAPTS